MYTVLQIFLFFSLSLMYRTSESYMQIGFLFVQKDTFGKFLEFYSSQNTGSCDSSTLMAKILVNNAKTYSKTSE
jgi:hypothetical protein